ncbi:hypothetical protein [Chitinivibrio alkaliphilus]|uniref:hypothetical protein n=1 Tax=Chitinivibrio alkaliphilus TaxID=1505232 RepID=UPI0003F54120|nr:hypothetical protein [Chitinivibrio alkaliphilus]
MIDEEFDADEVLRDMDSEDDLFLESDEDDDDVRELNFGNRFDENANFNDIASDLDTAEDLWE